MAHCQESNFFLCPLPHLSFFSIFSCFQEFCTSLMLLWYCHNKHSSVLQKKTVPLCWLCVLCVSELDQLMDSLSSTGTRYCITFGYLTNTSYTETILYIFSVYYQIYITLNWLKTCTAFLGTDCVRYHSPSNFVFTFSVLSVHTTESCNEQEKIFWPQVHHYTLCQDEKKDQVYSFYSLYNSADVMREYTYCDGKPDRIDFMLKVTEACGTRMSCVLWNLFCYVFPRLHRDKL